MHKTLQLLSTAALALAVSGAALAQGSTSGGAGSNSGAAASGSTTSGSKLAHQDSAFMKDAAEAGIAEVQGSQLALQQATSADVKTFAQTMVDDHTKANDELKALASQKGVKLSDKPSMVKAAELKVLSKRKDTSFDKHYADSIGVKAHEDTIKLFQKEVDKGTDADVKAWASKTLPALQHHLQMAQELKAKTDAEPKK